MNTLCEVCGDIGFKRLLLRCRDCMSSAAHQYCLEKVIFDASLLDWVCYECLQKRGEVSCSRSLEIVLSERPPNYAHFDSPVHEPVTKRMKLSSGVGLLRNRISHIVKYKSLKKRFKRKPNMQPMGNCTHRQRQIATSTDHADSLKSCDTIGTEIVKGCNGGNQHVENDICTLNIEHDICTLNVEHPIPLAVKMATTSMSMEESGEDISYENRSLDLEDLQAPPRGDYVLSRTSYLSETQKESVMAFIQETKPGITVFVSVIGKSNVQLPGPCLGISKEYALAYFPHESTKVTLQRPGMSKTWHPLFYKRNKNRKNLLMGQWLDFVQDNSVQEGDICLLEPTNDEGRSSFMVHLLRGSSTHATIWDGFQRIGPYPGESIPKIASEFHRKEEQSNEKHVSSERAVREISHDYLESEDSDDPITPPYILPCKYELSKSQKRIVEQRVRAIRSEVPIYVTEMKNNNAGVAQRWMLEMGVRFAAVYLPSGGRTVVLRCMGKTWNIQMVIHNGRRWFLNGGWTKFARDNGLRVGDICLFELKKNEENVTMDVHIISREQF